MARYFFYLTHRFFGGRLFFTLIWSLSLYWLEHYFAIDSLGALALGMNGARMCRRLDAVSARKHILLANNSSMSSFFAELACPVCSTLVSSHINFLMTHLTDHPVASRRLVGESCLTFPSAFSLEAN